MAEPEIWETGLVVEVPECQRFNNEKMVVPSLALHYPRVADGPVLPKPVPGLLCVFCCLEQSIALSPFARISSSKGKIIPRLSEMVSKSRHRFPLVWI